jgi:hypothetical protein
MTPARNRVTPHGDLVAVPLRGAFTGNRGILHDGREIVRFHAHDSWVSCSLEYKGLRREQWVPHRMTWLFFHDEAVSFAAGHRPCALCRRSDYDRYRAAWADALGGPAPSAKEINRVLHGERIVRGTHRRRLHDARARDLPDGVFVELDGAPHVLTGDAAVAWTVEGYGDPRARPRSGTLTVITPPSTVAALGAGYAPQIDPGSARWNGKVADDSAP